MCGLSAGVLLIRGLLGLYLFSMYFLIAHPVWTLLETALGGLLCLAILARSFYRRQTPLPVLAWFAMLFWFVLTMSVYLNYIANPDPAQIGAQIHKSLSLLFSLVTGYSLYLYTQDRRELIFTSWLICLCTLGLCGMILAWYTPGSQALHIEKTVLGFGSSNQNAWAMAILLVPALLCATERRAPLLYTLVLLSIALMLLTNATATASRQGVIYAGLLALGLALRSGPTARLGLALASGLALPIWLFHSETARDAIALILERFHRGIVFLAQTNNVPSEGSLPERLEMAATSLTLWLQSPLYGWGVDGFSRHSGYASYAHNSLSEILVSGGLLAAASYAGLLICLLYVLQKSWPVIIFLMASLLLIVVFQTRAHWVGIFLILAATGLSSPTCKDPESH